MREIQVEVTLKGGQSRTCVLPSDSEMLHDLYVSLANAQQSGPMDPGTIVQLPLDDGQAAWTFMSGSLISVTTRPPVLVQPREASQPGLQNQPGGIAPAYVCIDDFLTPDENVQLLQYALENEDRFEGSTVISGAKTAQDDFHRKSRVLYAVGEGKWRKTFMNRLKLHLPHIAATLGFDDFTFDKDEIQLTASNDGDFFRAHSDSNRDEAATASRTITFVYYFHRLPKPYSGGDLLLYGNDTVRPVLEHGSNVTALAPKNNCLVSFASHQLHEVDMVHCPSGEFSDSRFTVNGWLRRDNA